MDPKLAAALTAAFATPWKDGAGRQWDSQWAFVLAHTNSFDIHRLTWLDRKA